MDINIFKLEESGYSCDYKECNHNPEYHDTILRTHYIKIGTICAMVTIDTYDYELSELYCRECIDRFYQDIKLKLNSSLWVFK
jgi:hypothetical protein